MPCMLINVCVNTYNKQLTIIALQENSIQSGYIKAAGERRKCIPVELDAMAEYFMKLNECDEIRKWHVLPCIEDYVTIDEEEVWGARSITKLQD